MKDGNIYIIGRREFSIALENALNSTTDCKVYICPVTEMMPKLDYFLRKIKRTDLMLVDLNVEDREEIYIQMTAAKFYDIPVIGVGELDTYQVYYRTDELCEDIIDIEAVVDYVASY